MMFVYVFNLKFPCLNYYYYYHHQEKRILTNHISLYILTNLFTFYMQLQVGLLFLSIFQKNELESGVGSKNQSPLSFIFKFYQALFL